MLGKRTYAYLLIVVNVVWLAVSIYEWSAGISEFGLLKMIALLFNGGLGFYLLYELKSDNK